MVTGSGMFVFSDIYNLDNVVRHVGIVHGRNLLVDVLREAFSRDREYHYVRDIFGYPKTPDHTGLEEDAGYEDDDTTRIFIGTTYRYENSYLPAINVRQTSTSYKPIAFNGTSQWVLEYEKQRTEDGYGNVDFISVPARYVFAGAWEQSFEIKILSHSQEDTAQLADLVMIILQANYRTALERNGLFIREISAGGESTESTNNNDPVYSVSITANTYSEWRREIPVANLVDRIHFCFSFDMSSKDIPASSLTIEGELS